MARVELRKVTKRFGNVIAADNVDLNIEDGSFTSILGPSGCGKTTTLRMIAGLETPTEGEIYIDDTLVNDLDPKDRDIAMVFQFYAMYPDMNAFEQIAFPLRMRKVPREEIANKVDSVARRLGIAHLLDTLVNKLTVDQKQRIALARAIVRNPKVYLLDEPLTNLDANLRIHMRAELKRLQKELGSTTIFVTHDQLEAVAMSDRVAVMKNGRIMQYDTSDELYERPRNVFVAGFIGTPPMNFFEGSYLERNSKTFIDTGEFLWDVSDYRSALEPHKGSSLMLGVRPEYVQISKEAIGDGIKGRVDIVEPRGDRTVVNLKVGRYKVKANTRPLELGMDEDIWMTFQRERVLIFDSKTGDLVV